MICRTCHKDKPETDFAWKNQSQNLRNKYCKQCHNVYGRRWYAKNQEWQKRSVAERRRENKIGIREHIKEYLKSHPCGICGETDPIVLEFHHRDPKLKRANIGHIYGVGFSWSVIKSEIDKCDVLCANCHRRVTAKNQGWFKSMS